jgi:hypothetical protein
LLFGRLLSSAFSIPIFLSMPAVDEHWAGEESTAAKGHDQQQSRGFFALV